MTKYIILAAILFAQTLTACTHDHVQQNLLKTDSAATEYSSETLIIRKISSHTYQHISFLKTNDFGNVSCNGMIVVNGNEAVIYDTPATEETSQELIDFLKNTRGLKINGVVATHFHADCLGGLPAFHNAGIPSYASARTIEFAKAKNFAVPQNGFKDSLALNVGGKYAIAKFVGEGHTRDNVVGYFPDDKVLFGGCLIKEFGAGKGNLEDANTAAWPETVRKVKAEFPQAKVVIPGHGKIGGTELLDFTVELFEK